MDIRTNVAENVIKYDNKSYGSYFHPFGGGVSLGDNVGGDVGGPVCSPGEGTSPLEVEGRGNVAPTSSHPDDDSTDDAHEEDKSRDDPHHRLHHR